MSHRSDRFRVVVTGILAGTLSVPSLVLLPTAFAADAAKADTAAAAAKPAAATAAATASPTITSVRCKDSTLSIAWTGSGVAVVDYYSAGPPALQARKDPKPDEKSVDISLGSEMKGRKLDVRIWDKDVKLLDTKSGECPAS